MFIDVGKKCPMGDLPYSDLWMVSHSDVRTTELKISYF